MSNAKKRKQEIRRAGDEHGEAERRSGDVFLMTTLSGRGWWSRTRSGEKKKVTQKREGGSSCMLAREYVKPFRFCLSLAQYERFHSRERIRDNIQEAFTKGKKIAETSQTFSMAESFHLLSDIHQHKMH
ncbi:hypothetical protein PIB30_053424 [Stylosanthes scabra]|uniref:Uncharacterized protein n=1 Tax=Stylosanthes scabra TaxID=79078 RepID=A0ABU6ZHC0_9FABA|nr:hypothetical protein [Stylosanthes scabra]